MINNEKEIYDYNCKRVISQPGDWTKYDYIYNKIGPNEYTFMPCNDSFNYPQRLNYYEVLNIKLPDYKKTDPMPIEIIEISNTWNCNPWTVIECIRTILLDHDGGKSNG